MYVMRVRYRRSKWWRRRLLVLLGAVLFVSNMSLPTNYANSGDDWRAAQAENATEMIDRTAGAHSTDHIIRHTVQQIEDSNKQTFDETESKEIYRQLLQTGRPVQRTEQQYKRPEQPTVYLTFDDGPSRLTPQILDILQDEGVPATFFVLGKLAEQNADTLQRIVHEGHAVGNHTYDHDYSKLYTNFGEFFGQVERTDEIIHQVTGSRTPLFRAPGGTYANFEAFYSYYMEQSGFVVYDWDVDSGDSKRRGVPASEIIANVKNAPLKHEMNVLLHDGAGHGETVKALPEIIRYYKKLGYSFAALDRSVEPRRFTMKGLRWERTISEQNHLHYMELVSRFRAERGADFIDLSQASPTSGKQLTLSINGRTHILEERDYMVVDGHFQVPLGRLVEGLGGKVVQRLDSGGGVADRMIRGKSMARIRFAERMSGHEPGNDLSAAKSMSGYVLGNGLSAAERMPGYVLGNNISIADRMVSYESMNGIDMNIDSQALRTLRIDAYMNGYAVTYYPYEKMMEVQVSSGRTVARSRVQMHMKDGRLFVPLRGTVEMLGGTIPSYTLTNEKQEVRIDMGARDPGKPIPAVVAVGGVWK